MAPSVKVENFVEQHNLGHFCKTKKSGHPIVHNGRLVHNASVDKQTSKVEKSDLWPKTTLEAGRGSYAGNVLGFFWKPDRKGKIKKILLLFQ